MVQVKDSLRVLSGVCRCFIRVLDGYKSRTSIKMVLAWVVGNCLEPGKQYWNDELVSSFK